MTRVVCPDVPHHVTQRGNFQADMFFSDQDRLYYLHLLRRYASAYHLRIWAWCLMTNHVHLVAVPSEPASLWKTMREVFGLYARHRNALDARKGLAWQGRYYSCALGPSHLWRAVRYVEQNPVRAAIVDRPQRWEWSSARAHLTGHDAAALVDLSEWNKAFTPAEWGNFLGTEETDPADLQRSTRCGHPLGDESFFTELSRRLGRDLHPVRPGRPTKKLVNVTGF